MTAPSLELDLDEFSTRYWESCQEVMSMHNFSDNSLARLSSPLPETTQSELRLETGYKPEVLSSKNDRNYVSYDPSTRSRTQTSSPSVSSNGRSYESPELGPLHKRSVRISSQESPLSNETRIYSKIPTSKAKTKGKLPHRPNNVGNPFYNKGGSQSRRASSSNLGSRSPP